MLCRYQISSLDYAQHFIRSRFLGPVELSRNGNFGQFLLPSPYDMKSNISVLSPIPCYVTKLWFPSPLQTPPS